MMELVLGLALGAAGLVLTGVGAWVGVQVAGWAQTRTKSTQVAQFVSLAWETAGNAVGFVAAGVKAGLIEAAADGRITAAEAARLQDLAVTKMREWLGVEFPARAEKLIGLTGPALQDWLRGLVQRRFQADK